MLCAATFSNNYVKLCLRYVILRFVAVPLLQIISKNLTTFIQLFSTAEDNINSPLLFDTVSRTFNLGKYCQKKRVQVKVHCQTQGV
jgi:hypothetical protein